MRRLTTRAGVIAEYASTSPAVADGAPLTNRVGHQPGEIDVAAGALDNPDSVTPAFHIYDAQAPGWMPLDDGLPRFIALRPETRGLLEQTDTSS